MAITLEDSGTQAATLDTEHTLTTQTGELKTFVTEIDTAAMVDGDIVIFRIYTITLTSGAERLESIATYANVQGEPIKRSPPVPADISYKATLEQTDGTGRAYPWKVLSL